MALLFVLVPLLWPSAAKASLNEGLLKLVSGRADCRNKRFADGVRKLLESALIIQRASPQHPANRQWLPAVRTCLRSWVNHTAQQCKKQGRIGSLERMLRIQKKVKYLAAPMVKRMIKQRFAPCAREIVRLRTKECLENPQREALNRLDKIKEQLAAVGVDKRTLGHLSKGRSKCAFQWIKESESRCKTNATVGALKEIGAGVGDVGPAKRAAARMAYEGCAKALGTRGWQICQSRRYVQGRRLLKEAATRYGFFRATDKKFLRTMRSTWLPRCGTFHVTGYFSMRVGAGAVSFKLAAKVNVEVTRTGRGNTLQGEMRVIYSAVTGVRKGCRVLITPRDGRYSLTGSENPTTRSVTIMLERGMPQTPALEELQVTCGDETPDLSKVQYVHQLLKRAGVFSIGMSSVAGAQKGYNLRAGLGAAKGSIAGTLTLKRLR
ncbi:MAG: hypothetical protein ABI333_17700 [bacterium]